MTVRGVLFDFSGTLFHLEPEPGPGTDLITTMASSAFLERDVPAEIADDWHRRDLDSDVHRAVHLRLLQEAGVADPGPVYELMRAGTSWRRYPDTIEALTRIRSYGLPVAVISNIAWDIDEALRLGGAHDLVDSIILSYVEGVQKPDPRIFELACERVGIKPTDALMIGDSPADAAATDVGAEFEMVANVPTRERPDALITALAKHGIG
ncbi:HAD family hydrolase [Labedaea rhizosphaerae]|uniref:HAD superfamily hydrolase (TIGR01493 family)/HAD superfamily hydrolase (TIGR01509 family)/HAD superfamily hydrolase (TIGR01549 family) n=1 Tax=Labedaea rhizosphaerae TaxID=598644 RepID=A0A4R6SLC7_LABRH|nr:HAD family hydrolase [Labedaea rhizosphaerae]TDQ04661.1 HAD superfamily hydrolase (TIGR01493 family)/HAD superfamily hydrolase (TIGR01509 family)/HAD superfamily hydrolase (TIGR01549 family) [Labedaea rhizosphaerae]